jgi:hypothetical protein
MEIPNRHARHSSARSSVAATDQTVITADFETFLLMLTTQLKNQDPLNPMESTEYATQLATFSGVEQQVRTNELLETLTNGYATQGLGQLSGWIGMQATAEMPVAFSGAPGDRPDDPAARADRLELVVTDGAGRWCSVCRSRFRMRVRMDRYRPPGRDAAAGNLYARGRELGWRGPDRDAGRKVRATVEEAQLNAGEVVLTMQGGIRCPPMRSAVYASRRPKPISNRSSARTAAPPAA